MDYSPQGSSAHGIFPGKNTGVGCYFLLQGIFQTWGLNSNMLIICLYYIFNPQYLRVQRKEREINTVLLLEFSTLISLLHFKNDLEITVQGYRYALWQMNKHAFCSWHACYFNKLSSATDFYNFGWSKTLWATTLCTIIKPK